jgi:DNA transposition AAA+ family ATPase
MNSEIKIKIMEALEGYMKQHNISANVVAKNSGVNAGYLSAMRAGNVTVKAGDKEVEIANKYYEAIAKLVGFQLQKSYWNTVPTPQMIRILATLEDAKKYGYTNVIIGETGSGKTYVAEMFAARFPLDCFKVTVSSQDNIGDLLEKVCEKIHIATEKSKSKTLRAIARKLKELKADGNTPVLIFDEAEYMRQPALCNMKELYDNLNGICSIVLLGTDQLTRHIDKMRKKNRDGIPQLYRRIRFGIQVLPTIDRMFKQFLNDYLNDVNLVKFLRANCDNYGELHDVLVPALREADRTGQPLSENFIRTMLNMPNL